MWCDTSKIQVVISVSFSDTDERLSWESQLLCSFQMFSGGLKAYLAHSKSSQNWVLIYTFLYMKIKLPVEVNN